MYIILYMKAETEKKVRTTLLRKMSDLLGVAYDTVDRMSKGTNSFPDPLDRAMSESSRVLELRERDRERKLLRKIREALVRLEEGSYGICELCKDEISEERLIARPETTLCIDCKEEQEDQEKRFG